jgi:murein DD-endopeptidase MepM/ murein hydrolase activator NlpD
VARNALHKPGGHRPPPDGEPQPLRPGRHPRDRAPGTGGYRPEQGGGGGGFVNVNRRLFAPLQGLDPDNVLQGGYGWLSITDGGQTFHPGLDLNSGGACNADEGLAVVAPLAGVVRQALAWNRVTPGEGSHVWVELDDVCLPGPTWWHTDHLFDISCYEGQRLSPGEPIGLCGRTGGWGCAHAHTELLVSRPQYGWYQWPLGWSRAQVEAAYYDPRQWWEGAKALVLAEGGEPVLPETVQAMDDWQVANWILATLYEWANASRPPDQQIPFNPSSGLSKTWVAALRAGHYAGRPRTDERAWGDPKTGVWAEFDYNVLVYRNDGVMSWTG